MSVQFLLKLCFCVANLEFCLGRYNWLGNWGARVNKFWPRLTPAVLIVGLVLFSCGTSDSERGEYAPEFSLRDANDQEIRLSDFQGKVVLLNFWATWCGPCKIEMPWFVEFQRKYKDQGFSVIGISMDEEGWDVVRPFTDRFHVNLNFPIVIGNDEIADKYGGIVALPTTYIIDREGRVALMHQGLTSKGNYEDEIEQLL